MKAYVFPGQGSQFEGMGNSLLEAGQEAKDLLSKANEILGFDITEIMTNGTAEQLKDTKVTQPAIFLHSVITARLKAETFAPDSVAGHSLGEFSALTASGALTFETGLSLVSKRANAMQNACDKASGTMAAIVGLEDERIEEVCAMIDEVVIPANYNCPGQLVISGSIAGVEKAVEALKERGAKRALILPVGGAFHSPLMEPAREELAKAINEVSLLAPQCPIYQNVDGKPQTDPVIIKENLIKQLTDSVRWTQTMTNMKSDGLTEVFEVGGNGKVLSGMFRRFDRSIPTNPFLI